MTKLVHEPVLHDRLVRREPAHRREFLRLSRREQRALIAQDVIDQLDNGKLVARGQQYLAFRVGRHKIGSWRANTDDALALRSIVGDSKIHELLSEPCDVCAVGAVFVAIGRRCRDVSFDDMRLVMQCGVLLTTNPLLRAFPRPMLQEMEHFFEMHDDARRLRHLSAEQRLRAVMTNVIENNGTFVSDKLPYAKRS